jgi:hypothetical protein
MALNRALEPAVGARLLAQRALDASHGNLSADRRRRVDCDRAAVRADVLQVTNAYSSPDRNPHELRTKEQVAISHNLAFRKLIGTLRYFF